MDKRTTKLLNNYKRACNELASAVNEQIFEGYRDWWWVGDAVGGICCFEDVDYLNTDDMYLIIFNEVDYDTYSAWRNANLDNKQFINLKSWLKGLRHDTTKKGGNE